MCRNSMKALSSGVCALARWRGQATEEIAFVHPNAAAHQVAYNVERSLKSFSMFGWFHARADTRALLGGKGRIGTDPMRTQATSSGAVRPLRALHCRLR
jgi:hypothetical protein